MGTENPFIKFNRLLDKSGKLPFTNISSHILAQIPFSSAVISTAALKSKSAPTLTVLPGTESRKELKFDTGQSIALPTFAAFTNTKYYFELFYCAETHFEAELSLLSLNNTKDDVIKFFVNDTGYGMISSGVSVEFYSQQLLLPEIKLVSKADDVKSVYLLHLLILSD